MITPISNNYNNYYTSPGFKSYRHAIKNRAGDIINRGDTCILRNDLDFDLLILFLEKKYQLAKKVNIIAHACSDGEEAYSFFVMLLDMAKKGIISNINKYLPIRAFDKVDSHINLAKNGEYIIESFEKAAIEFFLGDNFNKYFTKLGKTKYQTKIKINDNIKNNVIFKQSDIMKDIENLDLRNTVLFLRNCWPYFKLSDAIYLAKRLSHKMDSSSTLIIGDYDKSFSFDSLLKDCGFIETEVNNVFELKTKRWFR